MMSNTFLKRDKDLFFVMALITFRFGDEVIEVKRKLNKKDVFTFSVRFMNEKFQDYRARFEMKNKLKLATWLCKL